MSLLGISPNQTFSSFQPQPRLVQATAYKQKQLLEDL
jgi:hypothetical protein